MKYLFQQIASIVRGKVVAMYDDVEIRELLLDTRKVIFPEVSLFFALPGDRRDGHTFIKEAYKKGIRNFVVSHEKEWEAPEANIILVRDVLNALQLLAAHHRQQFNIPVIGITGSNGKTIVKEWLNQLLDSKYNIVRSPRSYNSQIGVPLSVWQLDEGFDLGIFEAGISQRNEMDKLQKIIQPTIGVFTNVGDAHSGGFVNTRQKINEKLQLFAHVKALVYCKDYPELNEGVAALWKHVKTGSESPFEIISWSSVTKAELQILTISKENGKATISAEYRSEVWQITIPFTDDASIENAITCWCVLLYLGVDKDQVRKKMAALHAVAMRLELKNGINNSSVINDSYSADLSSLTIAMDFLGQQHQHPKRTVILTDFLESGRNEKELYADIASALKQKGVNRFIGIGPAIARNEPVFQANTNMDSRVFASMQEFRDQFPKIHFGNETILLKGARVFGLEQINRLLEEQTHQTVLDIDLGSLLHNLRMYQQILQPSTKLMAMVKAFSYGSGSYEIASALQFNKVDYLAVAYADEGVELRKGGINLPVMVMNPDISSFNILTQYNLEPEIYSVGMMKALGEFLKGEGITQFPVHVELETGMHRLGFAEEDLPALLDTLRTNTFKVQSVFSHLVGSEDPSLDEFTSRQADLFQRMSSQVQAAVSYPVIRHLLNSSGIFRRPDLQMDMVRLGIGLYGVGNGASLDLREVSTLRTAIAQIKSLKPGESVSYGRSGMIHRESRIATVRIGYADGYPRELGNGKGKMRVRGVLAPTIGNICMDMTMIDITGIPDIKEGDEVIVFGKTLPVGEVASWAGTIPYELLTGVSQRVKRVYFQE